MRVNKWLALFLIAYFTYLCITIDPSYLNADQASHAMTSVFFNRLITDWLSNPTFSPSSVYGYANAYYVRYPKFTFLYGPLYPLVTASFFLVVPYSVYLLKLFSAVFAVLALVSFYLLLRELFNRDVALLGVLISSSMTLFIEFARSVMPDMISVFLFNLGLFFYFRKRKAWFNPVIAGVLVGLCVIARDFGLVYAGFSVIIAGINFFKDKRKNLVFVLFIGLALLPYVLLMVYSGGIDVLLDYPRKQLWYAASNNDPQWTSVEGWLYFFYTFMINYSFIALPFFIIGCYYVYRKGSRDVLVLLLLTYLAVTFINDKAPHRFIYMVGLIGGVSSLAFFKCYDLLKRDWHKIALVFVLTLMLVLPFGYYSVINVPMSQVASDIVSSCPDCTVLVASEVGKVYSSGLMYEALVRDSNASLRFLRPTIFDSLSAKEVIESERVNRVVVIGSPEFLESNPEVRDYYADVVYVMSRYKLVGYYPSDIVGGISVYDTGVTDVKMVPYCFKSIALGESFCTNYSSPVDALRA